MFTAFWGEQQAAVAIVAAACIFECLGGPRRGSPPFKAGWQKQVFAFSGYRELANV